MRIVKSLEPRRLRFLVAVAVATHIRRIRDVARARKLAGLNDGVSGGGGGGEGSFSIADVELPRDVPDETFSLPTATTYHVAPSGQLMNDGSTEPTHNTVQAAVDAADALGGSAEATIRVKTGVTWDEEVILRDRGAGTAWVYIVSDEFENLPAVGTRAGAAHIGDMFYVERNGSAEIAFSCEDGAHHYRVVGANISTGASGSTPNFGLVQLGIDPADTGDIPHHIWFDRCYADGPGAANDAEISRAFAFHVNDGGVVDSTVEEITHTGADCQAIWCNNSEGRLLFRNLKLEATGENFMCGGADQPLTTITSDVTFSKCWFHKPDAWFSANVSVKNNFELKSGRRFLIEDCVMENNWKDSQIGEAILVKSTNEGGGAPHNGCEDITFRWCHIKDSPAGFSMAGDPQPNTPAFPARRVAFLDCLFSEIGDNATRSGVVGEVQWNIYTATPGSFYMRRCSFTDGLDHAIILDGDQGTGTLDIQNCKWGATSNGVFGSGAGEGEAAMDVFWPSGYTFTNNELVGRNMGIYPAGNSAPASYAAGTEGVDESTLASRLTGVAP